mmetsp:Transcript_127737/g.408963  ORF Transcript_127737/g.408963 Transcript_127737/m.408963 type:complete len:151 (-) Transcript_127737:742-1194(-)
MTTEFAHHRPRSALTTVLYNDRAKLKRKLAPSITYNNGAKAPVRERTARPGKAVNGTPNMFNARPVRMPHTNGTRMKTLPRRRIVAHVKTAPSPTALAKVPIVEDRSVEFGAYGIVVVGDGCGEQDEDVASEDLVIKPVGEELSNSASIL